MVAARRSDHRRDQDVEEQLKNTVQSLQKLIRLEDKLEASELSVVERKIEEIDRVVSRVQSRRVSQDLLTERQRLEERLSRIQSRHDFLANELERFQLTKTGSA